MMSVATKIGIQLNVKLGGEVWALEIPVCFFLDLCLKDFITIVSKFRLMIHVVFVFNYVPLFQTFQPLKYPNHEVSKISLEMLLSNLEILEIFLKMMTYDNNVDKNGLFQQFTNKYLACDNESVFHGTSEQGKRGLPKHLASKKRTPIKENYEI